MKSICVLWAQYGPYHLARVTALRQLLGPTKVHAIEIASRTADYDWKRSAAGMDLITLCPNSVAETLGFAAVFQTARRAFHELEAEVCLLPSYAPKQSLAALLAARSLGVRTVMMNETHAGTARSGALGTWLKRRLVALFDTALVGGQPQKRYFTSLGLPAEKIFTGYDAVDNDYFARRAEEVRSRRAELRNAYALPENYFLSLGRFVAKKNLATLLRAYRDFLNASQHRRTHLVMVGSGAEESALRSLCAELKLPIYDKSSAGPKTQTAPSQTEPPGVHFYGFRQIEENPVFYALADAFILPSLWEEWGLVVNEAMASSLPVVVSETAGCVEDLLELGSPSAEADATDPHLRRNGFVFPPNSPRELSRALLLLESSAELRETMGQQSRRIVEKCSCRNFAANAQLAAQAALGKTPTLLAAPVAP